MDEINLNLEDNDPEPPSLDSADDQSGIFQEVEEIKDAVHGVLHEAPLMEKVESLRAALDDISEEVHGWRNGHNQNPYLETLDTLKLQVNEIQDEWYTVAATLKTQRERLETLLESFPGVIETSALRALSLRVTHVEQLVSELMDDSRGRSSAKTSRIHLSVSFAALVITVVLWGVWISIGVIG